MNRDRDILEKLDPARLTSAVLIALEFEWLFSYQAESVGIVMDWMHRYFQPLAQCLA